MDNWGTTKIASRVRCGLVFNISFSVLNLQRPQAGKHESSFQRPLFVLSNSVILVLRRIEIAAALHRTWSDCLQKTISLKIYIVVGQQHWDKRLKD
jgi:hypothetical protein